MQADPPGLPRDIEQFWTAVRHQFKFYLHTSRFLALLLIVLLASGAFVGVTFYIASSRGLSGTPSGTDYVAGFLSLFGLFGILIGSFMGGDAIAMDFGSGTGYYTLVLPVRRAVILLGRYVAAFVTSAILIVVFYGVVTFGSVWLIHDPSQIVPAGPLLESLGLALLYALGILSVAFFFSAFFRSSAVAIVATVLILIFGLNVADSVVSSLGYTPYYSLLYGEHSVQTAITSSPSIVPIPVDPAEGAAIMLAYFVGFLLVSLVLYQFKESKG